MMTNTTGRLTKDAVDTYHRFCAYIDATHAAGPCATEHAAHIAESAKVNAKEHFTDFISEQVDSQGNEDVTQHAHVRFCTAIDAERFAYIKNRVVGFAMDCRGYDRDLAEKAFENIPKDEIYGINLDAHDAGCNAARAVGEEEWHPAWLTRFGGVAYDVAYIMELCERVLDAAAEAKAAKFYEQHLKMIAEIEARTAEGKAAVAARTKAWEARAAKARVTRPNANADAETKADFAEWLGSEEASRQEPDYADYEDSFPDYDANYYDVNYDDEYDWVLETLP